MEPEDKQATRRLEELYARLPKIDCKRQCAECCGPVVWSRLEWERIPEEQRRNATSLTCPYVQVDGTCEVYEKRPLTCRLFGIVSRLRCPYRDPERMLTPEEEADVLKAYIEICNREF